MYCSITRTPIWSIRYRTRASSEVGVPLAQITPNISSISCFAKLGRLSFLRNGNSFIVDGNHFWFQLDISGSINNTTNKSMDTKRRKDFAEREIRALSTLVRRWSTGNEKWLSTIQRIGNSQRRETRLWWNSGNSIHGSKENRRVMSGNN